MDGDSVEGGWQVPGLHRRQLVPVQVHPLEVVRQPLEGASLDRGDLTVGQVQLGQERQPSEGAALDHGDGVVAQTQHHQSRHVILQRL